MSFKGWRLLIPRLYTIIFNLNSPLNGIEIIYPYPICLPTEIILLVVLSNPCNLHLDLMLIPNRPQTFDQGQLYLHQENSLKGARQTRTAVIFISYTACPALVIIRDKSGNKKRCSRDDLFILDDPPSNFSISGSAVIIQWLMHISSCTAFLSNLSRSIVNKTLDSPRSCFKKILN